MPDPFPFRFSSLGEDVRKTAADMAEMLQLRHQLATEEIRSDLRGVRRLTVAGSVGLAAFLIGLSMAAISLARLLERWLGIVDHLLPLIVGAVLVIVGLLAAISAWRRFRREFLGLRNTLDELREDIVWLREWTRRREEDDPPLEADD